MERLYGMREVCELTRLSRRTIERYMANGRFPSGVKPGGGVTSKIFWRERDLRRWLTGDTVSPDQELDLEPEPTGLCVGIAEQGEPS